MINNAILLCAFLLIPARAASSDSSRTRQEYEAKARAELDDLKTRIRELDGRLQTAAEDARRKSEKQLKKLHRRYDSTDKELSKLKAKKETDWEKFRARFDSALEDLRKAYRDLVTEPEPRREKPVRPSAAHPAG